LPGPAPPAFLGRPDDSARGLEAAFTLLTALP